MSSSPNPFERLHQNVSGSETLESQHLQFEDGRVRYVMRELGLERVRRDLQRRLEQETGSYLLTFAAMLEEVPNFPMRLGAHKLTGMALPWRKWRRTRSSYQMHQDKTASLVRLMDSFWQTPATVAYDEFLGSLSVRQRDRPVGLVVPRITLQQGLVIHDDTSDTFRRPGTAVLEYWDGTNRVRIEPLKHLVEGWKREWSYE